MSLILDALRRSERARQRSLQGRLGSVMNEPNQTRVRIPWAALIGIVLFINAVALAALYWSGSGSRAQESTARASGGARVRAESSVNGSAPHRRRGALRSLAAEAAGADARATTLTASAAAPAPQTQPQVNEATNTAAAATNQVSGRSSDTGSGEITPIAALPETIRQSLPTLHLDVHVYNNKAKDRFVMINMHRYQSGDVLPAGPQVLRITRDGVVLSYQGHRFLLPTQQP